MKREEGFTLAELAIVIAVLGVLIILGIISYTNILEENKIAAVRSEAVRGADAVYAYNLSENVFSEEKCYDKLAEVLPEYGRAGSASGTGRSYEIVIDNASGEATGVDFTYKMDDELWIRHRYFFVGDYLEARALTSNTDRGERLKESGDVDGVCGIAERWCDPS